MILYAIQIKQSANETELRGLLVEDEFSFVGECGFVKPVSKVSLRDVDTIIDNVCIECVVLRSSNEMSQFLEGLDALHVGSLIKVHPLLLKQLFTYSATQVTSQDLRQLLVPVYSPRGSNAREEEEAVMLNWNYYLQDIEGIKVDYCTCIHCSIIIMLTATYRGR